MVEHLKTATVSYSPISDHSLRSCSLQTGTELRGRGLWRLNPELLADARVDNNIKSILNDNFKLYPTPVEWDRTPKNCKIHKKMGKSDRKRKEISSAKSNR